MRHWFVCSGYYAGCYAPARFPFTLDKPVYSPEAYHTLRELYRQVLAKQAEALVIKKAGS